MKKLFSKFIERFLELDPAVAVGVFLEHLEKKSFFLGVPKGSKFYDCLLKYSILFFEFAVPRLQCFLRRVSHRRALLHMDFVIFRSHSFSIFFGWFADSPKWFQRLFRHKPRLLSFTEKCFSTIFSPMLFAHWRLHREEVTWR